MNNFYNKTMSKLQKDNFKSKFEALLILDDFFDPLLSLLKGMDGLDFYKKRILQRFVIAYSAVAFSLEKLEGLDSAVRILKKVKKLEKEIESDETSTPKDIQNLGWTYARLFKIMGKKIEKSQTDFSIDMEDYKKGMHYYDKAHSHYSRVIPTFFPQQFNKYKTQWGSVSKKIIVFGKQDFEDIRNKKPFEAFLNLGIDLLYCNGRQMHEWCLTAPYNEYEIKDEHLSTAMALIFLTTDQEVIQPYLRHVQHTNTGVPTFAFNLEEQYKKVIREAKPIHELLKMTKEILGEFQNKPSLSPSP